MTHAQFVSFATNVCCPRLRPSCVSEFVQLESASCPRVQKERSGQLFEAVEKVRKKELSLRSAAATYGIPRSTLSDRLRGVSSKR